MAFHAHSNIESLVIQKKLVTGTRRLFFRELQNEGFVLEQ